MRIKQGETAPLEYWIKKDDGRTPVDLTKAASVKMAMRKDGDTEYTLFNDAIIAPGFESEGKVIYEWGADETETPGMYLVEWYITWEDDSVSILPRYPEWLLIVESEYDNAPSP